MTGPIIGIIIAVAFVLLLSAIILLSRYKKCPPNKIMVIYGKASGKGEGARSMKCIHCGAKLIVPIIHSYTYLDLTPISISIDLKKALSKQNIRIDVPSRFTVGISTEQGIMQNAAVRLLPLRHNEIQNLAEDIILGQLRLIIATMKIEEINTDRDKFLDAISSNVETELNKIGLRLINVNVTDINDESGYIAALGREAASKAINEAKISVAENDRMGSIGAANAEKDQRVQVALADSEAIRGENQAKVNVAESDATRRERQAESLKRATAAENIQQAMAREESYKAQEAAERARAALEKATLEADTLVKAEIERQKLIIEAEADAEQIRRKAKGEADSILLIKQAEAAGMREILTKQAEGLAEIVRSAGGTPADAVRLIIADKLEELVKIQVEAVKGIKIDKVTVWDGNGGGSGEKGATAGFVSGLMKSVPPLHDLFDLAGMKLPTYLGTDKATEENAGK